MKLLVPVSQMLTEYNRENHQQAWITMSTHFVNNFEVYPKLQSIRLKVDSIYCLRRLNFSQLDTGLSVVWRRWGVWFSAGPVEDNIQKKWTFKLKDSKLSEASLITYCLWAGKNKIWKIFQNSVSLFSFQWFITFN